MQENETVVKNIQKNVCQQRKHEREMWTEQKWNVSANSTETEAL